MEHPWAIMAGGGLRTLIARQNTMRNGEKCECDMAFNVILIILYSIIDFL